MERALLRNARVTRRFALIKLVLNLLGSVLRRASQEHAARHVGHDALFPEAILVTEAQSERRRHCPSDLLGEKRQLQTSQCGRTLGTGFDVFRRRIKRLAR